MERMKRKMAEMLIIVWVVIVIGYYLGRTFGTKIQLQKYAELDQALEDI